MTHVALDTKQLRHFRLQAFPFAMGGPEAQESLICALPNARESVLRAALLQHRTP